MTTEQQRKMLEAAAKACGFKKWRVLTSGLFQVSNNENWNEAFAKWTGWNPLTNPHDTATMCAKLDINTYWWPEYVDCTTQNISCDIPHDGTPEGKEAAWRLAASMVAAKIGGYENDL